MPAIQSQSLLSQLAPAPCDLGMSSDSFPRWRPIQIRSVGDGLAAPTRFVAQNLACGAGKSLSNVTQGLVRGRTVYLAATKALQCQLLPDFTSVGMVDIRGRGNYPCSYGRSENVTCEDGLHLGCKAHKEGACPYVNQLNEAKSSDLVVTNYSYWIAINMYGEGLGDVDTLVCDEAAAAVPTGPGGELVGLPSSLNSILFPVTLPPTILRSPARIFEGLVSSASVPTK